MRFLRVRSLQSKILILFVFLLFAVQLVSFFTTFKANQQLEAVQLNNTLVHAKDVFKTQFENRRYYLSAFAETAAKDYGLKSVLQEDTKSFLVALNNHRSRINADIALAINPDGIMFAQLVTYQANKNSKKKKVKVGDGQGQPFPIDQQYMNKRDNELLRLNGLLYQLSFAPIKSGARTIGWVGFGYMIDNQLSEEFANLTDVNIGFVLDDNSTIEVVANSSLPSGILFTSKFAQQLMIETSEQYVTTSMPLGRTNEQELLVIMFTSKADLLKNINVNWQQFFVLMLLTLALSVLGAFGIAKGITRPIKLLIKQIHAFSHGNYGGYAEVKGSKEVVQLADEFNHMAQAIVSREKTISFQAFHDGLTKLPNKNALLKELELRTEQAQEFMLLQLSLIGADEINDTLGYKIGDEILVEVAQRVQMVTLTTKSYYLGGESFVLLLEFQDHKSAVEQLIHEIMLDCHFGNVSLHLRYAIGIADSKQSTNGDMAELLQKSSVALQQAVKNKLQYQYYDSSFDKDALERLHLTNSLKTAIEENQLVLYYQPKLALDNMRVTHVEALVRWEHPEKGLIPPDSFISIAEKTGQMDALTRWVTREAFKQYLLWQRKGTALQIAINISAENLLDKQYSDFVIDLKQQNNIPDDVITLEVTEDAVVADPITATELLIYLKEHGFKLSIDDYGTGYSSLAQLKQLPVQELKVDRSFLQHLATDPSDQIIVKSSIELAHNLGLTVVAEGIEDEATLQWLKSNGCELAQGYYISRPQPAHALELWIEDSPYEVETVDR
ncbi:EAL domain-containing protein [Thalassotalea atypica]|uniref:EAL domain-containing protein n=1 Tax=Thalassotalea atypica TaxID=2054316 RepID=UPI00257402F6|nr:EAL domain-containing protein [Thalassotalea atypica]